ncbi:prolipoprotein diacylglyceryl transferase family protein [Flavobacterium sp.]|uniref:prolipoprotein diacylglyceryl transferase n=1 Tax=Flavobacterium sp. TaxID=239 RepID=UPI0026134041|nr:prolipoprotein diacylglyceryl transferase family protein [Flavobacterium sp.]
MIFFPDFPLFEEPGKVHYIFECLAFVVGIRIYNYHRKSINDPISDKNRLLILFGAVLGAFLGSRFIAILEDPGRIADLSLLELYQSKTIAGGFLGGLFGVELMKKGIGVRIASGDVYVFPILIAVFIGRIGCFVTGIKEPTFGNPTHFFFAMDLGDGIPRHPVALYEMFYLALLYGLFYGIRKRNLINGDRFKLFMVLYFLYRFLVEFIKPYHPLFLRLSIIHLISLFLFIYYFKFLKRILIPSCYENQRLRLL